MMPILTSGIRRGRQLHPNGGQFWHCEFLYEEADIKEKEDDKPAQMGCRGHHGFNPPPKRVIHA